MTVVLIAAMLLWLIALVATVKTLRGEGFLRSLQWFLTGLCCAGAAGVLTLLVLLLQAFHAFTAETPVATVRATRISSQEFELAYLPSGHDEAETQRYRVKGDQWAISGGVVKWHRWVTAAGVPSYHKPMRIGGQYSRVEQQRAEPPTAYDLGSDVDTLWELLYWMDPYLPFIEAVYGSSAYVYIEPNVAQDVYVTPTGYLIKRRSRARP